MLRQRTKTARTTIQLPQPNRWQRSAPEIIKAWRAETTAHLRSLGRRLTPDDFCGLTRAWYDRWDETSGGPVLSDCGRGCSICCRRYIDVIVPEVMVARDEVLGMDDRETILERLRAHDDATRGMDSSEYFSGHHDCPFVADDGACSIYPARPLACRYIHGLSREECERTDGDPDAVGNVDAKTYHLGGATHCGFARGLDDAGYNVANVVLPWAVRAAIDEPDRLIRWAAGDDAFHDVRAVY